MKQYLVLGAIAWYCNAMIPKQVTFAEKPPAIQADLPNYSQLARTIITSQSEPLIADLCIACSSCPIATTVALTLYPESSGWWHLAAGGISFCSFLVCLLEQDMPEGTASEQLAHKLKKDVRLFYKKVKKE